MANMQEFICKNCGAITTLANSGNWSGCLIVLLMVSVIISTIICTILLTSLSLIVGIILFSVLLVIFAYMPNSVQRCPKCRTKRPFVPLDSPMGKDLYNKFYNKD